LCGKTLTDMPIHIAITRLVRPGCEEEFQEGLREFLQASFAHGGVMGASMLTPPPGSGSREFGVLRTFADEKERDDFYESPMFKAWDERARALTEGLPTYRELHGLEAWFRSPHNPPPRWKMAIVTFAGVYAVTTPLGMATGPLLASWPILLRNAAFNVIVVGCLTWLVMPILTRVLRGWLRSEERKTSS
jgi:antibiotic biosynthesis monooxygenase (ABM) superfamily enzyme